MDNSFIYQFLEDKNKVTICVVGDTLIDKYYNVKANKISPEFPIPILEATSFEPNHVLPGGAANLCYQFKHFNVDVKLFSIINQEAKDLLEKHNISTEHCIFLENAFVPVKSRYYDDIPLCRLDFEQPNFGFSDLKSAQQLLRNRLVEFHDTHSPEVIIFSDYGKGLFENCEFEWLVDEESGCPQFYNSTTIVDPKNPPLNKWHGCDIFKPNALEAKKLTGESNWITQCEIIKKSIEFNNSPNVIITHGSNGIVGNIKDYLLEYNPGGVASQSVIGAGDTFTAFLGMAVAKEMYVQDAAKVAYHGAAAYVQKKFNNPVSSYELMREIDPIRAKYVDKDFLKNRDFKLVVCGGCFDLLHPGHVKLLQKAKLHPDEKVAIAINTDASVQRLKGSHRPIMSLAERMFMLASLDCVDFVIAFDEDSPYNLIEQISPDVFVKGAEYKATSCDKLVKEARFIQMTPDLSTSKIISRVAAVI